jgi:hypothetical protein
MQEVGVDRYLDICVGRIELAMGKLITHARDIDPRRLAMVGCVIGPEVHCQ